MVAAVFSKVKTQVHKQDSALELAIFLKNSLHRLHSNVISVVYTLPFEPLLYCLQCQLTLKPRSNFLMLGLSSSGRQVFEKTPEYIWVDIPALFLLNEVNLLFWPQLNNQKKYLIPWFFFNFELVVQKLGLDFCWLGPLFFNNWSLKFLSPTKRWMELG